MWWLSHAPKARTSPAALLRGYASGTERPKGRQCAKAACAPMRAGAASARSVVLPRGGTWFSTTAKEGKARCLPHSHAAAMARSRRQPTVPQSGLPPPASPAEWSVWTDSSGPRSSSQLGSDPSARFQSLLKRLRGHPLQVPVGGEAGITLRQQDRPDRNGWQWGQRACRGMRTNRPFWRCLAGQLYFDHAGCHLRIRAPCRQPGTASLRADASHCDGRHKAIFRGRPYAVGTPDSPSVRSVLPLEVGVTHKRPSSVRSRIAVSEITTMPFDRAQHGA